ncbi:MAG: type VI secretion system accessory protein TagJ, partial [Planctomycetota bacterium]
LSELFCFAGEWERADKQLDAIGHQDPQSIVGLSLMRQLIRAEVSRSECWSEGRPPEVLFEPEGSIKLHLEALAEWRSGEESRAAELCEEAEASRTKVTGVCDGQSFEGLRDLDDLCAGFFEVLTSTGKYYWTPIDRVRSVEFEPAKRPQDVLWRRATMEVADGPCGEVFLPSVYPATRGESDDRLSLSRVTDWVGGEGPLTRGVGQRMFLVGDEPAPILQIETLEIAVD